MSDGFQMPTPEDYQQWRAQATAAVGTPNAAVVPLWESGKRPKPHKAMSPQSYRLASEFASIQGAPAPVNRSVTSGRMATVDEAKVAFLDMTPGERSRLRKKAIAAGLMQADGTDATLYNVWQQLVSDTADYNATKKSNTKYISPWEAIDKLTMDRAGKAGAEFDGYSEATYSATQQFREPDIASQAEQVFQAEMGRNPTKAELAAYTMAVNQAAKANPVVTKTVADSRDPAHPTQDTTTTGTGVDPQQVILDRVREDPEQAAYQASTLYYQAALNALNALVAM